MKLLRLTENKLLIDLLSRGLHFWAFGYHSGANVFELRDLGTPRVKIKSLQSYMDLFENFCWFLKPVLQFV
jgi:hypothetical protein